MNEKNNNYDKARLAACQVLHDVMHNGAFSNESSTYFLNKANLEARERAFASALIYGTLSRLPLIDAWLEKLSNRPYDQIEPWVKAVLRLGAWQLYFSYSVPQHAAIDESVKLTQHLSGKKTKSFVNGILRNLARQKPKIPKKKLSAYELGLTTELFGLLKHWYGEQVAREIALHALEFPQTQTVRVNLARKNEVKSWLASEEARSLEVKKSPWPQAAFEINLSGRSFNELEAYKNNLLTAQSASAMLVASLLPQRLLEQEKIKVLDLCSAPGGKLGHLIERLGPTADFLACDIKADRLNIVKEFVDKRQYKNVDFAVLDATENINISEQFDLVLCDVPCSGLGLLARRPEIRWRASYDAIERIKPQQRAILQNAARLVAAGGCLYYTTCTINPDENSGQIAEFLSSDIGQNFTLDNLRLELPDALRQTYDSNTEKLNLQGDLSLFAHRDGSDGFYLARMQRNH